MKLTRRGIFFTSTNQDQSLRDNIAETKSQIIQMKRQYEEISTILILYMKSNEDMKKFRDSFIHLEDEILATINKDLHNKQLREKIEFHCASLPVECALPPGHACKYKGM